MIQINENTRIAKILKANPDALDALVSVTPKFEKLRNPLLRKLMAGRTSLKEAAKIGKCDVQDIANALSPLGFEFTTAPENETKQAAARPAFMDQLDKLPIKTLDVRDTLAAGKDPLKDIMAVTKELAPGEVLKLINTFEPTPLITLLKNKGYESYVEQVSADEVYTFFRQQDPDKGKQEIEEEGPDKVPLDVFNEKLASFGDKVTPVDVREMEMPMPMVTILESMSQLAEGHVLSVQHKRIPVFLFNELKERNYAYLLHQAGDTDVRLLIWKNSDGK